MILHVLEWYDTAEFTTNTVINPTNAFSQPSPLGRDADSYKATEGIYFNPLKKGATLFTNGGDTTLTELGATKANESWLRRGTNAVDDIPNSIGTLLYYDRSTGQAADTVRSTDSMNIIDGFTGWNDAVAKYNSAVTQFNSDKAAYEEYAKDPSKTEVNNPTPPFAFAASDFKGL